METEAMYEGSDVASMTPRIFDRRSCRRCRSSGRKSLLAGAIWHGIATRADSTGSVDGRRHKEINDTFFRESVKEMIRHE